MSSKKVLVTPRSLTAKGHPAIERLALSGYKVVLSPAGRTPTEDELCDLLPDCVGYLAGVEPVTQRVLASAPNLRAISRNGVGVDSIDLEAAERAGVQILTAPGANAQGVAELALGLMFAAARQIPDADRVIKSGEWQRAKGIELAGRTLGVVGCGNVGRRVMNAAACMGMKIVAHDPYVQQSDLPDGFRLMPVDDLFAEADVVSLHAPARDQPLVDRQLLARCRKGLILVNTARAGLVDPAALLDALESGTLSMYATDVHAQEPPVDRSVVEHPRVIATAHVGGFTQESVDRATEMAVDNLIAVLGAAGNA